MHYGKGQSFIGAPLERHSRLAVSCIEPCGQQTIHFSTPHLFSFTDNIYRLPIQPSLDCMLSALFSNEYEHFVTCQRNSKFKTGHGFVLGADQFFSQVFLCTYLPCIFLQRRRSWGCGTTICSWFENE